MDTRLIRPRFVRLWDQLLVHLPTRAPGPFTVAEIRDDPKAKCVHLVSIEGVQLLTTYDETVELLRRPPTKKGVTTPVLGRFILLSAAWYGPSNLRATRDSYIDEVFIGSPDSGTGFALRWYELRNDRPAAPRLEVFDDAWGYFGRVAPFHALLARFQNQAPLPREIIPALIEAGFVDETPRERQA